MNSRRINQLLSTIATLCVTAGLFAGAGLVFLPLELPTPQRGPDHISLPATPRAAKTGESLADRTFRASVPVVKPPAAAAASAPSDLTAVQLVGTIGDSIAMLRGPDGTTALVEVGDDVNGAAVLAIRPFQIDLRLNGRKTTLIKSDGSDSNAIDPNAAAWPSQP